MTNEMIRLHRVVSGMGHPHSTVSETVHLHRMTNEIRLHKKGEETVHLHRMVSETAHLHKKGEETEHLHSTVSGMGHLHRMTSDMA